MKPTPASRRSAAAKKARAREKKMKAARAARPPEANIQRDDGQEGDKGCK
jgi:hypothetical protein